MDKPTIGRTVIYKLTEGDKAILKNYGASARVRDELPATVVGVDDTTINLQVLLDGQGTWWKHDVLQGTEGGNWSWPPRA